MTDNKIAISLLVSLFAHALALIPTCGAISHGLAPKTDDASYSLSIGSIQIRTEHIPSNIATPRTRNGKSNDRRVNAELKPGHNPASKPSQQPLPEAGDASSLKQVREEKRHPGISRASVVTSLPSKGDSGRTTTASGRGKEEYLGLVRRKIAGAKRYPDEALNEGNHGTALVAFSLHRDGSVSDIRVINSSLSGILDTEAQRTIRRAAPFPPVPTRIIGEPLHIRIPISFEIAKR